MQLPDLFSALICVEDGFLFGDLIKPQLAESQVLIGNCQSSLKNTPSTHTTDWQHARPHHALHGFPGYFRQTRGIRVCLYFLPNRKLALVISGKVSDQG